MNTPDVKTPNLQELLTKREDLDPELKRYVFETGRIGPVLQHPLIYEVPYHEMMNAVINLRFKLKKEAANKARAEGDYGQYIILHERASWTVRRQIGA